MIEFLRNANAGFFFIWSTLISKHKLLLCACSKVFIFSIMRAPPLYLYVIDLHVDSWVCKHYLEALILFSISFGVEYILTTAVFEVS